MFDADIHALFNVAITDDFVDDDTDSMGGNIVDNASAAEKLRISV